MRLLRRLLLLSLLLCAAAPASAQRWGQLSGTVTDADEGRPVPGVTIVVSGTDYGTASDERGSWTLRLPEGRYALRFSAVGFAPLTDTVTVRRDAEARVDVVLAPGVVELGEVTVRNRGEGEAGTHTLEPETLRDVPTPFKGLQALSALPGVVANNELSQQYSVRGGGFNENLVFIDGFEVYLPFRPRQGEQEGLGLLNPDLAESVTLYTGGFPARYGGKLASALEVRYRRPSTRAVHGSASLSLMDAAAHAGSAVAGGRLRWSLGLRKAQARHFFGTQELKGDYRPDYTDAQGALTFRLADGHELDALGLWANHAFHLDPQNRKTYFGTVSLDPSRPSNLQSLWTNYSGEERDAYATRFAGARLRSRLSPHLRAEHAAAYFGTVEHERYAIDGDAVLFQVDPAGNPMSGSGHVPLGSVRQQDAADNRIAVRSWTGTGRWSLALGRHAAEGGWQLRRLHFEDRLDEKSVVVGRTTEGDLARVVVDSLHDEARLDAVQAGFYLQETVDLLPQRNRLLVTGGVRTDYFSFNGAWTVSSRLSAQYRASERLHLNAGWGVYHQAPTYRELRGAPEPGETILGALDSTLQAQRSVQFVAGMELFFPTRRLYLRGEAYHKQLDHLISYRIENVRVLYSGANDSYGYAQGLDLQLRGEFVPGLESWVNYSFLRTAERFLDAYADERNGGFVPRPTDQRHTVSAFVQDYVPGDESWKLHLRGIYGSGLPYTPPIPGPRVGQLVTQIPGDRASARYPAYRRLDLGVTKQVELSEDSGRPVRFELTGELLNVFDMTNTVAYAWVPNAAGIWQRIPTRLTPRTINVRMRVTF